MTATETTARTDTIRFWSQYGDLATYRKAQAHALTHPMRPSADRSLLQNLEGAYAMQNGHDPDTGAECPKRYPGLPSMSVGDVVRVTRGCRVHGAFQDGYYAVAGVGFIRITVSEFAKLAMADADQRQWIVRRWANEDDRERVG